MSRTVRLLLIRHGQPSSQLRGRCYGRLDAGLSAEGEVQARRLALSLASAPLAAVYSSPRERAAATAAPLAASHQLIPALDERLAEIDFGAFEGMSYAEIERRHPELYRQWMDEPTQVRFPGGEGYPELRDRALAAMAAIRDRHPGELVAIVGHGGGLRAMLAACLNMPDEAIFRLEQSHGAVSRVDWINSVPLVRAVNLRPAAAPGWADQLLPPEPAEAAD